jgi:hypothetical protein
MSERRIETSPQSQLDDRRPRSLDAVRKAPPAAADDATLDDPRRHRFARGLFGNLRRIGAEAVSITLGRLVRDSDRTGQEQADTGAESPPGAPSATVRKLGMLHGVTERLRGAADSFVAAKLDEIEARVDVKLDDIEGRIDHKLVQIHKQLGELRDREIRHRLRLLKLTLIFTVLVGLLSLGYKWLTRWMAG